MQMQASLLIVRDREDHSREETPPGQAEVSDVLGEQCAKSILRERERKGNPKFNKYNERECSECFLINKINHGVASLPPSLHLSFWHAKQACTG